MVSRAFAARGDVTELVVHTGQHYDHGMSQTFFDELGIPSPTCNLGIGSGSHGAQTGRMLEAIEQVLMAESPDWVLVYGDTNSTLAGALAAAKLHLPVAHVEAGLRSFNRAMPEEQNRVLVDHLAELLFAPTNTAVEQLCDEGIALQRIDQCGDVMFDVALHFGHLAAGTSRILERHSLTAGAFTLATVHRAENTDSPARLAAILGALAELGRRMPVVLPLHPRTRKIIDAQPAAAARLSSLRLIEPVGYLDMARLTQSARLVVTDSGGLQKEAFFHSVPCVTVRDETEWTELVNLGWNRLAPPLDAASVAVVIDQVMAGPRPQQPDVSPYGDGRSALRIAERLATAS